MGNSCVSAPRQDLDGNRTTIEAVQQVLQNDLLLEKILNYVVWRNPGAPFLENSTTIQKVGPSKQNINFPDVWTVLRTCQFWRQMGMKILTRHGIPLFDFFMSTSKEDLHINVRVNTERKRFFKFSHFVKLTNAHEVAPYSLYMEYESLALKQYFLLHSPLYGRISGMLVSLTLKSTNLMDVSALQLPSTILSIPNLRLLDVTVRSGCVYPQFTQIIQTIMQSAPILQKVWIFYLKKHENDNFTSPTEFYHWSLPSTVTHFQGWNLSDAMLHDLLLHPTTFPHLRNLNVWNYPFARMSNTLYDILHRFRESLEDIQLSNYVFAPVEFPEMNKLVGLRALSGGHCMFRRNNHQPQREQLDILKKKIHCVKTLSLDPVEDFLLTWQTHEGDKADLKFDSVIEFKGKLSDTEKIEMPYAKTLNERPHWKVNVIWEAFPNLRSLCLDINQTDNPEAQIRFLFTHFSQLSTLSLSWRCGESMDVARAQDDLDSLLIGCSPNFIPHLRKHPVMKQLLFSSLDDPSAEIPSVRLLNQLTTLRLNVSFQSQNIVPSDLSFRYAFFKMPELVTLQIGSTSSINKWPSSKIMSQWHRERGRPFHVPCGISTVS